MQKDKEQQQKMQETKAKWLMHAKRQKTTGNMQETKAKRLMHAKR